MDIEIISGSAYANFGSLCKKTMRYGNFVDSQMRTKPRKMWSFFAVHSMSKMIVGSAVVSPMAFQGTQALSLDYLVVHPEYRNKGIGTRLMQFLIEQYAPHMILHLDQFQDSEFPHLSRWYSKFGFRDYHQNLYRNTKLIHCHMVRLRNQEIMSDVADPNQSSRE